MLNTVKNPQADIQQIVEAIKKKDKVGFRHYERKLYDLSKQFTPAYRDFVLKIINSRSIEIVPNYREGYMSPSSSYTEKKMSRKQKSRINNDMNNMDCLPHELGHCCDFWFGKGLTFSSIVVIEDNKTLYEIFKEEFEDKHEELYQMVMEEFKNIINSNINEGAFSVLENGFPLYQELRELPFDPHCEDLVNERKRIQKQLYKSGFVETYYQFYTKRCCDILNSKYSPILDALSSKHNFDGFGLHRHSVGYYRSHPTHLVEEFFANVFAAKVTSKHTYYDYLIKYLPRSFNAFEKLFVIFYDHIQNNKRFTDVKLKEVK